MYIYNTCVSQMNMNVTPEFEKNLAHLMKLRGFKTKSEAIRVAVEEAFQAAIRKPTFDFQGLLGLANVEPDRPGAQPITDDMLWEKGYLPGTGPDRGD
jgi:hypothetical protein